MADRLINGLVFTLYRRLGRVYPLLFAAVELGAALWVTAVSMALILNYFRPSAGRFLVVVGVACAAVVWAVVVAVWRGRHHMRPVQGWLDVEDPTDEQALAAWDAATNYAIRNFRANSLCVAAMIALPTVAVATYELHLHWSAGFVLFLASLIPVGYGTAINYAIAELMTRPLVSEIAPSLPAQFEFHANGLLLRRRLKLLLPIFTAAVAFVIAALMSHHGGVGRLAEGVLAAMAVGLLFSFELTVLLSRSVTAPIAQLRDALALIRAGEYSARVPVLTSDELGELSHDFNLMALGLAEREEMRDAFMTYLDRDIVPLILSGRFPRSGVEVNVTIMFLDVRGFTAFAERSSAPEVVTALNAMFETVVPIIGAHGGHVDKFLGDGLLALFGAPEGYEDHADRALAAGVEMARAVNGTGVGGGVAGLGLGNPEDGRLRIGIGINTGTVVAGAIGGGGRLNFSVIGDAVNVAARVEAATRMTGDGLLVTAATRDALVRGAELLQRDLVVLKGKAEPVQVYASAALLDAAGPASSRRTIPA